MSRLHGFFFVFFKFRGLVSCKRPIGLITAEKTKIYRPQFPLGMWKMTSALSRHAESAIRLGQFPRLVSPHRCRLDAKVSRAPNVRPSSTFLGDGHCSCTCSSTVSVRCYAKSKDKKSVKGTPPHCDNDALFFFFLYLPFYSPENNLRTS